MIIPFVDEILESSLTLSMQYWMVIFEMYFFRSAVILCLYLE